MDIIANGAVANGPAAPSESAPSDATLGLKGTVKQWGMKAYVSALVSWQNLSSAEGLSNELIHCVQMGWRMARSAPVLVLGVPFMCFCMLSGLALWCEPVSSMNCARCVLLTSLLACSGRC